MLEELEQAKARGANILAEVLGYATSGDAYHIAAPDEYGIGARNAMTWAMRDAGISPDQIGYINAHGTSTPLGDAAEVRAVKAIFGDHAKRLAMSSTKSMTGHALGAAGGIETIAVVKALQTGVLPPTINLQSPDDEFDLDFVPNEAVSRQVDYAINNSFGFGGHNVSLIFGRWTGNGKAGPRPAPGPRRRKTTRPQRQRPCDIHRRGVVHAHTSGRRSIPPPRHRRRWQVLGRLGSRQRPRRPLTPRMRSRGERPIPLMALPLRQSH